MTDEIPLDDALLQLREFSTKTPVNFLFRSGEMEPTSTHDFAPFIRTAGDPLPVALLHDRDVRTIVELGKAIDFDARRLFHSKVSGIMHLMTPVTRQIRFSYLAKTDPESG